MQREGKHAAQVREHLYPPVTPGFEQYLGIAVAAKARALCHQVLAQSGMVVDLAVEDDGQLCIGGHHGLMTGGAQIEDGQAAVTHAGLLVGREPQAFVVRATVALHTQHLLKLAAHLQRLLPTGASHESTDCTHEAAAS